MPARGLLASQSRGPIRLSTAYRARAGFLARTIVRFVSCPRGVPSGEAAMVSACRGTGMQSVRQREYNPFGVQIKLKLAAKTYEQASF